MRRRLALSLMLLASSAGADEIPSSWARFQVSDFKGDKAMVAQIEKADWWKNCVAWGGEARKKAKTRRMWALQAYLNDLRYINGIDLGGVTGKLPKIGMTTCGALAVLGPPDAQNVSQSGYSTRTQYVWRTKRVYVYTMSTTGDGNAAVTSIQY